MAVTATVAPAVAPKATNWAPTHLNIDAVGSPAPGIEALIAARYDFREPADGVTIDPSTLSLELRVQGQTVQQQEKVARVTELEREAMAGVRDAFAGANFLKDAVPFSDSAIEPNHVRFTWADDAGAKFMVNVPATGGIPAGYEEFGAALVQYNIVAGIGA